MRILLFLLAFATPLRAETLTIYTTSSFTSPYGPGPTLKELFYEKYGATVRYVPSNTALTLLGRLTLEGKKNKADLIIGLNSLTIGTRSKTPYAKACLSFIYDDRTVHPPPSTFKEFIESPHKIILQDPRTSATGLAFLAWMEQFHGQNTTEFWQKFSPHVLTYTKGWSESYALFLRGEAPFVLSFMTSPLYHEIVEQSSHYKALHFPGGHMCMKRFSSIPQTSKYPQLAQNFIDLLLSPEGQDILATRGWVYPMGEIPQSWKDSKSYIFPDKPFFLDPCDMHSKQWIKHWLKALL